MAKEPKMAKKQREFMQRRAKITTKVGKPTEEAEEKE